MVISIIGMLASMTLVALNSARARSRDAKRMSDMSQIYNALYSFYLDHGCLPEPGSSVCTSGEVSDGSGWDYSSQGNFLPFLVTNNYLPSVPVDPVNNMTGNGTPIGTYSYRYYCWSNPANPGLYLGFYSEVSGGTQEIVYSGLKVGNGTWHDSNFVCK